MRGKIKWLLTVITLSTLLTGVVVASDYTQTIEVMMNSIKIKVNGEYMSGQNIVYKGTAYAPLRIAGETLGKDVGWDQKTNTATIDDRPVDEAISNFKIPAGVPDNATLVEIIERYKYHMYEYNVALPNGGYVTQVTISNAPGEGLYSSIMGYDGRNEPFLAFRYKGDGDNGFSYLYGPNPEANAEAHNYRDHSMLNGEMDKFINAYDYE